MSSMQMQTPWVESPFFEKELKNANLDPETAAMVKFYSENGYVIIDPQIDDELIEKALSQIKPEFEKHNTNRLQDAWKDHEAVKQIAVAPRVIEILEILYKRRPIPFQTLNFSTGSQQRTHSDSIHFNSVPERYMAGVWIALEDVHDGNGPLHYYPASHRLPFYDLSILGMKGSTSSSIEDMLANYYNRYEDFIEELVAQKHLEKKVLNLKKGQALIWSANLLHGGEKITIPGSTRYTQVNHFYFENCAYYRPMKTDMALERISIQKVTDISTGKEVQSTYLGTPIKYVGYSYKMYLPGTLMRKIIPSNFRQWVQKMINK
ncbi:phytanoyl-CoA dioxygenase family protein [Dyadobacter sp. CY345]|uniref:phytanoyl-CoA dioxygenase family protein n=1 Tax=Dyadobacter sp. CY345 TaxID=2909335 RepID=UPI001F16B29E|nr:phytanoyl-CoA dioxygenase family protein [Dyadobacter sp. CY345]MCF2444817.1 phytanoyl-CoA dioxygenase family protein [Dyadobacter sp. CY345]